MHVDLIHTSISAAYFSIWLVIANIAIRRESREPPPGP